MARSRAETSSSSTTQASDIGHFMTSFHATADHYDLLRKQGGDLVRQGQYEQAEQVLRQAAEVARQLGNADLVDRALCNVAAIRIEHRPESCADLLPELREVLVRNGSPEACRLAAYHLARAYESRKDYKKGLFYARIALERTQRLEEPEEDWLATSHNQIGNLLAAESFFHEAIEQYRQALEAHPDPPAQLKALIEQNIGYCRSVQGDPRGGIVLLLKSYRVLRWNPWLSIRAHLDLSLAYLELHKYRHAIRHGLRGLRKAEEMGETEDYKNALFLLGEAAVQGGDEEQARDYFSRLQRFYPETPFLGDFLLATDVRQLVNLRA